MEFVFTPVLYDDFLLDLIQHFAIMYIFQLLSLSLSFSFSLGVFFYMKEGYYFKNVYFFHIIR